MITQVLESSAVWGVLLTLAAFGLGVLINKRTGQAIFNPLLLGTAFVIVVLSVLNIPYDTYAASASPISYLLLPATVSLAVPLYEKWDLLCKNLVAIVAGVLAGVMASLFSVLALALLLDLNHEQYITLLPKSVTTAISMDVSRELGGIATLTGAIVILTGIVGALAAETVCKVFRITNPIAKGIGIGTASHAVGTSKALEIGEVEGAMSGLSVAVAGIMTAVLCPRITWFVMRGRAVCMPPDGGKRHFLQVFCPVAGAALAARRVLYYNKNKLFVSTTCAKYRGKSAAPPGNRGLECAALTERGS